ncbi:hypothetical protein FNH09_43390 [Streptomyces adustus]|uniref:Uncharacterized protein n=1 Tax=Streptomyces adustus TaxID=1609272 RepID=A0A5N8VT16_9ACTN|nr:hypothetical protein [Streptomyces adustus]MPY37816.1 hypothetical protein [Streptomyces adustus]
MRGLELDRQAVFHVEELEAVASEAFARHPDLRARIRAVGGRVPDELSRQLTARQTQTLVTRTLLTARRWEQDTAAGAARLAARSTRRGLIVVEEDGSHEYYAAGRPDESGTGPDAIVYRRGGS